MLEVSSTFQTESSSKFMKSCPWKYFPSFLSRFEISNQWCSACAVADPAEFFVSSVPQIHSCLRDFSQLCLLLYSWSYWNFISADVTDETFRMFSFQLASANSQKNIAKTRHTIAISSFLIPAWLNRSLKSISLNWFMAESVERRQELKFIAKSFNGHDSPGLTSQEIENTSGVFSDPERECRRYGNELDSNITIRERSRNNCW